MDITRELLESKGACKDQIDLIFKHWPEGGKITLARCKKAALLGVDFRWAARNLLPADADKAYSEATAAANKAFGEATADAYKAFSEATAAANKAFGEATAAANKAYCEATAAANKAYCEATAAAFFEQLTLSEKKCESQS